MAEVLNCKGLKCPKPVLKVAIKARSIAPGSTLEVHADCPSFESDIKKWCDNLHNTLDIQIAWLLDYNYQVLKSVRITHG